MMHIPMQKWQGQSSDKTLAEYIQRKGYEVPQKRFFEDYANEMVLTKVGPRPRCHVWTEKEYDIAREAWTEARK